MWDDNILKVKSLVVRQIRLKRTAAALQVALRPYYMQVIGILLYSYGSLWATSDSKEYAEPSIS